MKNIVLTSIFSVVIVFANAQNENTTSTITNTTTLITTTTLEKNQKYHALGFNAGFSTGVGLSYRYQHYKHSYQFTIFPLIAKDVFIFNLGARYAFNFKEVNKTRFFGYIGHSAGTILDNYDDNNLRLVTGAGFGIEQDLTKNLSLNFGGGYAYYYYNFNDNKLTLTAELGLFYKFN
ncbi:MAG: hypothetical protein RLZZ414_319 [Bacteroidota bacterium]|jgi:hypothetical protein